VIPIGWRQLGKRLEERNARRRKAVPVSAIVLSPNAVAVQAGTGVNMAFGVVAGPSFLLILLFAGLRLRDLPKTSEVCNLGFEFPMGLRPTCRDESPFLAPIDSKWVMRDFRRSVMGSRVISHQTSLRRDADASKQVGEPGIGAKGVPERLYFEVSKTTEPLLASFFYPSEGLIFIFQPGVNQRNEKGGYKTLLRSRLLDSLPDHPFA
jgi:hypothetical protein